MQIDLWRPWTHINIIALFYIATSNERFEYIGDGFEAGECGIRLPAITVRDSGAWTCNVGFVDTEQSEQTATIQLIVQGKIY